MFFFKLIELLAEKLHYYSRNIVVDTDDLFLVDSASEDNISISDSFTSGVSNIWCIDYPRGFAYNLSFKLK